MRHTGCGESVINTLFAADFTDFRARAADTPQLTNLERYMFNPLTARPFLRLDHGRLIAIVPQLIAHRFSQIELYYDGLARWGERFTHDTGEPLEDYVGRQLGVLPNGLVQAEIPYDGKSKAEKKSVGWIVVFDDLLLLVEAKSTRLRAAAGAGNETA